MGRARELAFILGVEELRLLNQMDQPCTIPRLLELARRAAERQVKAGKF